ncbi:hypothetical protein HY988_00415 [Candidatus Micrarchaeota archaeon]|nr:hypothetical protein [Candidatus Micrarchaeota archaeon]
MVSLQKVSGSAGRADIEVPDAWRRVRAIQVSLEMRNPRSEYAGWQCGGPTYRAEKYDRKKDPLGKYNTEGLCEMLEEAKEELRIFWHERFYGRDGRKLFVEPYRWSERLAHAGFDFEYPGESPAHSNRTDAVYPTEQQVRLFVVLTGPWSGEALFYAAAITSAVYSAPSCVYDRRMDGAQLVRMLDPNALTLLINSLNGRQINELLYCIRSKTSSLHLIEKIASAMQVQDKAKELGDHFASMHAADLIQAFQAAGENGAKVAAKIIQHLERIVKYSGETLHELRKGIPR